MTRVEAGKGVDGKEVTIFLNHKLKNAMDIAINRVKKLNWDYVAIVAGIPGCLSGDTIIQTTTGNKTVKELANKTVYVNSFDFETRKKIEGKARVYPTGKKIIYELETQDGRKVKATEDHIFFVRKPNKILEVKLKDLKEGDELICEK